MTHTSGHTLDFLITREEDDLFASTSPGDIIADHSTVLAKLEVRRPHIVRKKMTYRKVKAIDREAFKIDIANHKALRTLPSNVNSSVQCYNQTLSTILDTHAPVKVKVIAQRHNVPWYNEKIAEAKREKRKCEFQQLF